MYSLIMLVAVCSGYQKVSFYKNITLEDLDNRLINMMRNPQKGKGADLMDGSFWYYSQLEDMELALKKNETNALEVIRNHVKKGRPKFATTPLNKSLIKQQFLWDKGDFLEFGVNVEGTNWIWDKFEGFLNGTPWW
jgi:hypothetical protein